MCGTPPQAICRSFSSNVLYEMCSTICGTPVQAISDHKNLTELTGGVREGQNLPQNGLNLALELSRGPQTCQGHLKWTLSGPPPTDSD